MLCHRHRMMNDDGSCPYCRLAERQGCAADAQKKRLEELEAENTTLRAFKEDIEYVAEREANDAKELAVAVKERIDAYGGE